MYVYANYITISMYDVSLSRNLRTGSNYYVVTLVQTGGYFPDNKYASCKILV